MAWKETLQIIVIISSAAILKIVYGFGMLELAAIGALLGAGIEVLFILSEKIKLKD